jgi:competence protein ComEC
MSAARTAGIAAVWICVACAAPAPVRPPHPIPPAATMRAHFIDVGQGDATLLEFPCGAALIDTGGEEDGGFDSVAALRTYLDAFFARRADLHRTLDLLVITHPHIDHTRGIPMVLERYRVRSVVDDGRESSSGKDQIVLLHTWLRAHPEVHHEDVRLEDIPVPGGLTDDTIDPIRCKDVDPEIRVLWGQVTRDPGWAPTRWGLPIDNENNHSVVVRLDFGSASFLFTGDLEEEALRTLVARYRGSPTLDVDVYKVGHHGSRNGTTEGLLRAMAWQYGHPGQRAVELLDKFVEDRRPEISVLVGVRRQEFVPLEVHAAEYGTGWDGTVVVDASTRGRLRVHTTLVAPKGN